MHFLKIIARFYNTLSVNCLCFKMKWKSLNNYEELDNDERLNANANGTALPQMSDLKLQCKCTPPTSYLTYYILSMKNVEL